MALPNPLNAAVGFFNRIGAASGVTYNTFKFAYANPGQKVVIDSYRRRMEHYNLCWAMYLNTVFMETELWDSYLDSRHLYSKTAGIFNPVRRLVDFYAGHLYPGVLSPDGRPLPNNVPLAIPLSEDTPPELRSAIAQLWQWGNWQQQKALWITYCASLGDGPIEWVDDVEKGQLYPTVPWPGHIIDVEFDLRGNVTSYVKQFDYYNRIDQQIHRFQRVVNKDVIATFQDGEPFEYLGAPAQFANPYGFCPLVWCQHGVRAIGDLPGAPAVRDWTQIEYLNSLVSQINAYIRKQAVTPTLFAGMGDVQPLQMMADGEEVELEDIMILVASKAGTATEIRGSLDLNAARLQAKDLWDEIVAQHPEISMYMELRKMGGQITGPAAVRLMGDVMNYLSDTAANYDSAQISFWRMGVAMASYRAAEGRGGWSRLSDQQAKFLPFDLGSYARNELNFSIDPRPMLYVTELERAQAEQQRYVAMQSGQLAGFPLEWILLNREGWTPQKVAELQKLQEADRQRKRLESLRDQMAMGLTAPGSASSGIIPKAVGRLEGPQISNTPTVPADQSAASVGNSDPKLSFRDALTEPSTKPGA